MRTVPNSAAARALPGCAAAPSLPAALKRAYAALFSPRRQLLDARSLPDHLKRDIGALDGNDPRGPRP